ncbi:MAG: hypothetical protein AB7O88_24805 [Reyranellaceae bacterium]
MARNRTISADFWTWEAVIDCAPMTRLLFIGLWNFADDHGVQPLRPRTIRMQVFPGDDIDNDAVRAMIDELAARKLVRIYEVEGVEYLAVVDWALHQRVGKRARRRFPADPSVPLPDPPTPSAPMPVPVPMPGPADIVSDVPSDRPRSSTIAGDGGDTGPFEGDVRALEPDDGRPAGFQRLDELVARIHARREAEIMAPTQEQPCLA